MMPFRKRKNKHRSKNVQVYIHIKYDRLSFIFKYLFFFTLQHLLNETVSSSHQRPYGSCSSIVLAHTCTSKHVHPHTMGVGGSRNSPKTTMEHSYRPYCIINDLGTDDSNVWESPDPGVYELRRTSKESNSHMKSQDCLTQFIPHTFFFHVLKRMILCRAKRTNSISLE